MIRLYICCLVLIIGGVEVGPDIDMKFHQEVMEIVSYDIYKYIEYPYVSKNCKIIFLIFKMLHVFAIILFSGGEKNQIYGCHSGRRRYQKKIWMRL